MLERTRDGSAHSVGFNENPARGEHRTLAEKAFTSLHQMILAGELKPGARLPIDDLAEMLGMSAMPVREAVRRLGAMGLVENVPHKGARLTELSVEDLSEVYTARLILEPLTIYETVKVLTEEHAADARIALDAMSEHPVGSVEQWSAHSAFHLGLYRAQGSSWLVRLIQPLWDSSERYRLSAAVPRTVGARREEHEKLLQACLHHDPAYAAFELYNHLASTANATSREMGGEDLFVLLEGGAWVSPVKQAGPPVVRRQGGTVGHAKVRG
ncbi:MAG: GntR family transcriptional regulator [Candidatus Dormibacteria bacterium]